MKNHFVHFLGIWSKGKPWRYNTRPRYWLEAEVDFRSPVVCCNHCEFIRLHYSLSYVYIVLFWIWKSKQMQGICLPLDHDKLFVNRIWYWIFPMPAFSRSCKVFFSNTWVPSFGKDCLECDWRICRNDLYPDHRGSCT